MMSARSLNPHPFSWPVRQSQHRRSASLPNDTNLVADRQNHHETISQNRAIARKTLGFRAKCHAGKFSPKHCPPPHSTPPRLVQNFADKSSKYLHRSGQIWTFPNASGPNCQSTARDSSDLCRISATHHTTYGEATLLNCLEGMVPSIGAQPGSGWGGCAASQSSSMAAPRPGASGTS